MDKGLRRQSNDDRVWFNADVGVFLVADGMGGMLRGGDAAELASLTLAEDVVDLRRRWSDSDIQTESMSVALEGAIRRADVAVRSSIAERAAGTTVVLAVVVEDRLFVSHVGDSRAVLRSDGVSRSLTVDHNLAAVYVEAGRLTLDEARGHPSSSRLTSYVGMGDEMSVDHVQVGIVPGDRLVLLTDGVTSMINDEALGEILSDAGGPQDAVTRLVQASLDAGGLDNIGVIVVDIG